MRRQIGLESDEACDTLCLACAEMVAQLDHGHGTMIEKLKEYSTHDSAKARINAGTVFCAS